MVEIDAHTKIHLEDLLRITTDAIIVIDPERKVKFFNESAQDVFGYQAGEVLEQSFEMLFPMPWAAMLDRQMRSAAREGNRAGVQARRVELVGRRKIGSEFPAEAVLTRFTRFSEVFFAISLHDLSLREPFDLNRARHSLNFAPVAWEAALEPGLSENEIETASVLDALEEGVVVHTRGGAIVSCNASAERILGLSADQIIGRTPLDLGWNTVREDGAPFPGEEHPAILTLRTGQPCSAVVMGVHKPDDTQSWISINSRPLCHPGEPQPYGVVVSFRDVTRRMHDLRSMERNLQDHTHKLATLLDVARDLASTLELKPLLVLILKRIRNVVQYTNAGIAMLEDDNFKIVEFQGPVSREKMLHFQVPLSLDSGYRRVMQSGRPVIIGDIWQNDPWLNNLHSATESAILEMYRDIHSWVGVPLMIRDDLVGILRLDHEVPYYYTEERMRLIMAFADHVALAIQNARVHEQSRKLSVMKERQKLARELHDSVSQALYGIALGLQTSQILLERDPTQLKAPLEYCLALANTGMAEMRALIFELRPESLELEGVVMALTKRAAALCGRYGIEVCETYCPEPPVSMAVKEAIFRIAQEALQNVIKHSQATSVEICLEEGDKTLELTLRDNGRGFKTTGFHPGHLGLKSMEERAEQVGGSFTLQSAPGQGTRIHVRIPVA